MKIIVALFVSLTLLSAQTCIPSYDTCGEKVKVKHKGDVIMQGFELIIDYYLQSTQVEKIEFMQSLDNEEINLFLLYLRDNYPEEFKLVP
jgi:hypothetical protein